MRTRARSGSQRGFTLIEVLVAAVVFSVFGVMAYGGLSAVVRQYQIADQSTERLREIQYALRQISQDIQQIHPRPVRDRIGQESQPALRAGSRGEFPLEFTRGGWSNLMLAPRSTLQRVAYMMEDDVLVRVQWQVLDKTLANEPLRLELLTGVREMSVRMLNPAREWQDEWPPEGLAPNLAARMLPMGVEIVIDIEDLGLVSRLLELPR